MPRQSYSYLDVAIMEPVRARLAAGDALVLLSLDLERLVWANGPGAALFGHQGIEAAIGAASGLTLPQRRQVAATRGFPDIEPGTTVVLRLADPAGSHAMPLLATAMRLPDGEEGILLAAPLAQAASRSPAEIGARVVEGFEEGFAVLADADGGVVAATPGFEALGLASATIAALATEVASESDRLVKRLVEARGRTLPAGIARIADSPALNLLLVVDEEAEPTEAQATTEAAPQAATRPKPSDTTQLPLPAASPEARPDVADDAEPEPQTEAEVEPASPAPEIDLNAAPVRFVWRTDAEGRFSHISPEFSGVFGEQAASVLGEPFATAAERLGLDPKGEIAGLLQRRDTWSGRVVMWPTEDGRQRIPVDLAALPVYDRDRNFQGFRGFGVARPAEAVAETRPETEEAAAESPEPGRGGIEVPASEVPAAEVPVPPEPEPDEAKVIRFAAHRNGPEGDRALSPGERNAFMEIGEKLRKATGAPAANENPEPEKEAVKSEIAPDTGNQAEAAAADTADGEDEDGAAEERQPPSVEVEEVGAQADGEGPPDEPFEEPQAAEEAAPLAADMDAEEPEAEPEPGPVSEPVRPDTSILERLPVPLLIHSGDSLHYANPEFLALTAYSSLAKLDEAGGLEALFAEPYGQAGQTEDGSRGLRLRAGDGTEFPIEAVLRSVPWAGGKALMLAVRRTGDPVPAPADGPSAAETELRARIAEMRTIIDTATDGVVLISPDGTIRSISRPAEALFGYESDEVAGKPFSSLFAVESRRDAQDYLSGLADNGVASVLNDGREVIGSEAEGRFIPLFMTIGRLPQDSGYCAVVRDITQWKRAEEELTQARALAERSSSQKTDFLARVSHEIRTPLNAIIGFSELMLDEKFGRIGNDRYRDYLRDINKSGTHVLDLVNDLLDISKIEAGQQEMAYEAVSLNDTLSEAVAMMQPQANRERVIIRSSLSSRLPDVVADLRSVRQIALNLLSNAVRFTPAGGQVIVSTAYEPAGDIVMRVRDTGVGMSQAEIEQALKPFKQINTLKRARGDGTGLGLPLTKAMVEANRARFSITSTPSEGTLVEVTFPSTRVLAE